MKKIFRVISLGAGVQSSTLAMLYENGILRPIPDLAVFADTQAEPDAVYEYLDFLNQKIKSFPIITCSHGNLVKDVEKGKLSPPFFVYKSDERYKIELAEWHKDKDKKFRPRPKQTGMLRRQCTSNYKIRVIHKAIKEFLGYPKYKRVKEQVEVILGISTDEITRMKDSNVKWITHKFPLIDDLNWSREDCLSYFKKQNLPTPARSACWMCPYHNDNEWIDLKQNHPKEFQKAVDFDEKIRKLKGLKYQNYLHRSCKPLGEVSFKSRMGKHSGMNEECDGLCGV